MGPCSPGWPASQNANRRLAKPTTIIDTDWTNPVTAALHSKQPGKKTLSPARETGGILIVPRRAVNAPVSRVPRPAGLQWTGSSDG
jgi:hypothetical protein